MENKLSETDILGLILIAIIGIPILIILRHICFDHAFFRWGGFIKYALLSTLLSGSMLKFTRFHAVNFALLQLCNYASSVYHFGFAYINSYLAEHFLIVGLAVFVQYLIVFNLSE